MRFRKSEDAEESKGGCSKAFMNIVMLKEKLNYRWTLLRLTLLQAYNLFLIISSLFWSLLRLNRILPVCDYSPFQFTLWERGTESFNVGGMGWFKIDFEWIGWRSGSWMFFNLYLFSLFECEQLVASLWDF